MKESLKKQILIVVPSFNIGGTIVSLHSLLSVIDTSKYKIDIFALGRKGVYLDKIPNCRILPENVWISYEYINGSHFNRFINKCLHIIRAGARRLGLSIEPILCKLANRTLNFKQYDTVVNYAESVADIVCHYPIKRRVAWIHCDYQRYLSLVKRNETKAYKLFDTIVCVSEFAKSVFCECMPQMAEKTVAIHNIINTDLIKEKAQERITDSRFITENFTIISAGRLDPVKQFHLIPQLAADVKKQTDKKFVWYIIGGDRGFETYVQRIRDDIVKLGVSDEVVMLGEKSNIYPYMAKADLYVSTSFSEAFPLVINEAKTLGIPVISNNFGAAAESIEDGVDGFVVPVGDVAFVKKIVSIVDRKVNPKVDVRSDIDKNKIILSNIYKIL